MSTQTTEEIGLRHIEAAAKEYAAAHEDLAHLVRELNEAVEAIRKARLAAIKRAVARVSERHCDLNAFIDCARHLFVKPRTIVFHGIKVGLQKGKGRIDFDDPDKVVALIEKHFPEQAELLIHTKRVPDKQALENLTIPELKKLGCQVTMAGDQIVIKPTDSEVDKIVAALLKEATSEEAA